jgi:hypothetical protein
VKREEAETIKRNEKVVIKAEWVMTLEKELREETGMGIFEAAKKHCPKKVKEALQMLANIKTLSGL